MAWWHALILGTLQGLTEFLPVSSSGHLVVTQTVFGLGSELLTFDIAVHVGTLVAVFVVFGRNVIELLGSRRHWVPLLIVGSVPAGLVGLLLRDVVERLFGAPLAVGTLWFVNGAMLLAATRVARRRQTTRPLRLDSTLAVGVAQALAILPGISRAGSTISVGIAAGLDREEAARFSFLLAIPAILGATALDVAEAPARVAAGPLLIGVTSAALVGYVALRLLLHFVYRGRLDGFAYYSFAAGLATVLWCALR